jgi:phospholipid transport system substrate-binding protein
MKDKSIFAIAFTLGISGAATAQPFYPGMDGTYGQPQGMMPYSALRQARQPGPSAVLKQGLDKLITYVGQENRPSEANVQAFLDREIAPYIDFAYMARWAAGRNWQRMTPQQRRDFESRLQTMFLGTLAQRLSGYKGQQVKVMRPRRTGEDEVDVGVAVLNPRGYPAQLKFRFYRSSEGWKVFDVEANGSSAVAYYRQYFKRTLFRPQVPRPAYRP